MQENLIKARTQIRRFSKNVMPSTKRTETTMQICIIFDIIHGLSTTGNTATEKYAIKHRKLHILPYKYYKLSYPFTQKLCNLIQCSFEII